MFTAYNSRLISVSFTSVSESMLEVQTAASHDHLGSARLSVQSWNLWYKTHQSSSNAVPDLKPSLTLQPSAVPLLPKPPSLQISGPLQPVHPSSQEDDDAARNQLSGHPSLPEHHTSFTIPLNWKLMQVFWPVPTQADYSDIQQHRIFHGKKLNEPLNSTLKTPTSAAFS